MPEEFDAKAIVDKEVKNEVEGNPDGVYTVKTSPEDMAFVRMMHLKALGKEPISEEVLDFLALFEQELKEDWIKGVVLDRVESKQPGYQPAVARAYIRYNAGERV